MNEVVVVFIYYRSCDYFYKKKLIQLFPDNTSILFIDTSDVNNYFEFSGYQHGLNKVLENDFSKKKVIFINDTIFKYHYFPVFKSLLKDVLNYQPINTISGLIENRGLYVNIPTCFFSIYADKDILNNIKFHPDKESLTETEIRSLYHLDEVNFNKRVNDWLYPTSFLKGWYKANPYIRISNSTYLRKRLAIYLESNLIDMCKENNVQLFYYNSFFTKINKKLDKVYINLIKLRIRMIAFLKHKKQIKNKL